MHPIWLLYAIPGAIAVLLILAQVAEGLRRVADALAAI